MSTIKSSNEDITINADGSGRSVKFQANGVEKASIDSSGNFTSTSIDATKLSGTVPNFTSTGIDDNATSTAVTLDSSGNVLVGTTSSTPATGTTAGIALRSDGKLDASVDGATHRLNRLTSDGDILQFRKDGSTVGSIGTISGSPYLVSSVRGIVVSNNDLVPATNTGGAADNLMDCGSAARRWDDIFATNGTIQTSDRNEKQDIEALSEAEQRVAVACKGLLRKFRWQDSVAEKGDDARIHFGIIAQDLQDAFAAEGLDAGRYAMFISTTWYEKQTPVDAVEAVEAVEATYDDEGNELTPAVEAVEAKDAYVRTDTEEEPTEGYTERTRLGVRYPELLAFIIAAL